MFTPIHRALGLSPSPLDWSLIKQAVDGGVREQADLDWKAVRHDVKENWHEEFSKDIAAMANAGGGMLVFGVNEDRATSAASDFAASVTLSDVDERMFRSTINARIHPRVTGVTFAQLDGENHSVLVIRIPASADAPHLIERKGAFGAPFRDGTRTDWMREQQIAAAYRARFAGAAGVEQRLASLYDEIGIASPVDKRLCFVAAAVPEVPRPAALGRVSNEVARAIFLAALDLRSRLANPGISPIKDNTDDLFSPRQGMRRQTSRYDQEHRNDPRHRSAIGSVHDDGSVTLSWSIGGMLQRELSTPNDTSARFVEAAVADFVALVGETARALGIESRYALQAGLRYDGDDGPVIIRLPDYSVDFYDQSADASIPIKRFIPARTSLEPLTDDDELLAAVNDLALDCVSQSGVTRLMTVYETLRE